MSLEGQRLGEFEILERLGQGGMGAVYRARQVSLDRLVALKTLQGALAADPEFIARFRREAKAAAVLNHTNLVQVYAAGETDGLHWFAMEYVEGESAQDRLKRKGRLDPAEAIAIGTHVATALDYAWRKAQIIHRDIKPDNIFLSGDGEVKLGDLGLAKSAGENQSLTLTGASMGTPHYVSPEQAEGKKDVDLRADIYSLGCTLYHFISGEPPFKGDTAMSVMLKHVTAPVPELRAVWPGCPAEISRVVMKMMFKQPASRQQSHEEVITDLRRAYEIFNSATLPAFVSITKQNIAAQQSQQQLRPAGGKRMPVAALAIGGVVLLCAIAALLYFAPWKKDSRSVASHAPEGEGGIAGGKAAPSAAEMPRAAAKEAASTGDAQKPATPSGSDTLAKVLIGTWRLSWDQSGWSGLRSFKADGTFTGNASDKGTIEAGQWTILSDKVLLIYAGGSADQMLLPLDPKDTKVIGKRARQMKAVKEQSEPAILTPGLTTTLPTADQSTPAIATKDKPFVNTLGMKFVPVPIVSGPSAGQRVLFGVWDVRVQDYAAYAASAASAGAKKVDDSWTKQQRDGVPVGRELNHPVVGVNWEDAQAFCQWLTEKESAEGKLPKGVKYRLPGDEEWSWAVGLPPELNGTPEEKSGKNSVDFPWGKDYPPARKVGNYGDETFHGKFPKDANDKKKDQPWMAGYDDGYATTSPVGSFPANAYGLYDMGGSVWQWCEDWFDATHKDRVLRGASWSSYDRGLLLSSNRIHYAPGTRNNNNGFRCVLGESAR